MVGEEIEAATPINLEYVAYIAAFVIVLIMLYQSYITGTMFDPVEMSRKMMRFAMLMLRKYMGAKMLEMTAIGLCLDRRLWESLKKRAADINVSVLFGLILVILAIAVGLYIFMNMGGKIRDALGILD